MAKNVPIFWLLIINTSLIHKASCSTKEAVHFELKTDPEVILETMTLDSDYFKMDEERQKLCFYAKMSANLAYIDYAYVPKWQNIHKSSPQYKQFLWGMYCPTLPTIYLLRAFCDFDVQITFLNFPTDQYVFDDNIVHADSVSRSVTLEGYLEGHAEEVQLVELNIEDERRNLCARVRDHVSVYFLGKEVPEAQLYEFQLTNTGEKHLTVAIPCPTSPELYLCRGTSEKQIKIILLKGRIDQYEFEVDDVRPTSAVPLTGKERSWLQNFKDKITSEDQRTLSQLHGENEASLTRLNADERTKLCTIARRYRVTSPVAFVEDVDVEEAQLYSFQYPNARQQRNVAIQCSASPRMYLRWDHLESAGTKIRITFVKNLADQFVYAVEVPDNPIRMSYEAGSLVKLDNSDYKRLKGHHPFTQLSLEDQWNFCLAAQSYILNEGENTWNFRFAERESIITTYKLLLIPTYMELWRINDEEYPTNIRKADVYIICSKWPEIYLRLGKSSTKKITVVLNKEELVQDIEGSSVLE